MDKGIVNDSALNYLKRIYDLKEEKGYKLLLDELVEVSKAMQDQGSETVGDFGEAQGRKQVSYWTVIVDPYFRAATAVVVALCLGNSLTGINAINSFSSRLLTDINNDNPDHSIKPALGNAMVGGIQWLGCLVAPFVAGVNVRKVLISGFLVMGAFEIALGIFNVYHKDTIVLGCLLGALFTYQVTLGTYTWTYIAEVGNEKN